MKLLHYFTPKLETILVEGIDALDFLQRLTTLNLKTLKPGEIKEGLLLTPQGKISGHFFCAAESKTKYYLGSSFGSASLLKNLDLMLFREQLTLTEVSNDFAFIRVVGDEKKSTSQTSFIASSELPNLVVEPIKSDLIVFLRRNLIQSLEAELHSLGFQKGTEALYEGLRLRAGCVEYPNELNHETNPLELGLDPIISENKGCYPGQEVIERIRSMGQAPRIPTSFRFSKSIQPNSEIKNENGEACGIMTSVAKDPLHSNEFVGFGLIRKNFAKPGHTFFCEQNLIKHCFLVDANSEKNS
jgi:folate-binding protein YgfZ